MRLGKYLELDQTLMLEAKVYIFDRFGKLLKELDPLTNGWGRNLSWKTNASN